MILTFSPGRNHRMSPSGRRAVIINSKPAQGELHKHQFIKKIIMRPS